MKTYKCLVISNWNWNDVNDSYIIIQTPKGTKLRIYGYMRPRYLYQWKNSDEMKLLITNILEDAKRSNDSTVNLTKEEVLMFKKYSSEQEENLIK